MTAPSDHPPTLLIRLVRRDRVLRTWEADSGEATVGSGDDNTITVRGDPSVEAHHATVYVEDGAVAVVAAEGAQVGVGGETLEFGFIGPDDELRIGRSTFRVALEIVDDEQDAPTADVPAAGAAGRPPLAAGDPALAREAEQARLAAQSQEAERARLAAKALGVEQARRAAAARKTEMARIAAEAKEAEQARLAAEARDAEWNRKAAEIERAAEVDDRAALDAPVAAAELDAPGADDLNWMLDDDDDDDDEDAFVEPFDLAELLLADRDRDAKVEREAFCSAMVVRVVGGRVLDTIRLLPGDAWGTADGPMHAVATATGVSLDLAPALTGEVHVPETGRLAARPLAAGRRRVELAEGQSAQVRLDDTTWRIDVFRPAHVPRSRAFRPGPMGMLLVVAAFALHLGVGLAVAGFNDAGAGGPEEEEPEEIFATVEVQPKKPKPKPRPDAAKLAEKAPAVSKQKVASIKQPTTSRSVSSVLERLRGSPSPSSGLSGLPDTTNIRAAPGGLSGGFDLMGELAALPGGEVAVARRGGSGGVQTADASRDAAAAGRLAQAGSGKVRGKVTRISSQVKVQGSLSPDQVYAVVDKNMQRIQACYEKALVRDAGLSGRIVFDWVVATSGSVSDVRVRSSGLKDTGVADCIRSLIRGWKFPEPNGGEVTITYPFVFRAAAM